MSQQPPPVMPDPESNAHLHRRRSDYDDEPIKHRRWYDSTKVQIAAVTAMIAFGAGAFGAGIGLRDWLRGIEDAPVAIEQIRAEHIQMRENISTNRENIQEFGETLDQMFCYVFTEGATEQQRCVDEQTRNRIQSRTQRPRRE